MDDALEASADVGVADVVAAFAALRRQHQRVIDALASDHGIAATDVRAIVHLADRGTLTPKAVGAFLGLTQGSMTALVDRIERADLVRRVPHPTDRRSLLLEITDEGERVAARTRSIYEDAFGTALGRDDVARVHGTFTRVTDALKNHEDRIQRSA